MVTLIYADYANYLYKQYLGVFIHCGLFVLILVVFCVVSSFTMFRPNFTSGLLWVILPQPRIGMMSLVTVSPVITRIKKPHLKMIPIKDNYKQYLLSSDYLQMVIIILFFFHFLLVACI